MLRLLVVTEKLVETQWKGANKETLEWYYLHYMMSSWHYFLTTCNLFTGTNLKAPRVYSTKTDHDDLAIPSTGHLFVRMNSVALQNTPNEFWSTKLSSIICVGVPSIICPFVAECEILDPFWLQVPTYVWNNVKDELHAILPLRCNVAGRKPAAARSHHRNGKQYNTKTESKCTREKGNRIHGRILWHRLLATNQ